MKNNQLIGYAFKVVLASGAMFFSFSCLNAWTIQVLDPVSLITESGNKLPGGASVFKSYLEQPGVVVNYGSSLGSYTSGDADAVIIQLPSQGYHYSSNELSVISQLLNSNTRTLIFGEHGGWATSNNDLAALLGGTASANGVAGTQQVITNLFPLITEGVSDIYFSGPGRMTPGVNGTSITSDNTLTMWGSNNNFLVCMDINVLGDGGGSNRQFASNVANWLGGADLAPIPEPSAYAAMLGLAATTTLFLRRRRSQV